MCVCLFIYLLWLWEMFHCVSIWWVCGHIVPFPSYLLTTSNVWPVGIERWTVTITYHPCMYKQTLSRMVYIFTFLSLRFCINMISVSKPHQGCPFMMTTIYYINHSIMITFLCYVFWPTVLAKWWSLASLSHFLGLQYYEQSQDLSDPRWSWFILEDRWRHRDVKRFKEINTAFF